MEIKVGNTQMLGVVTISTKMVGVAIVGVVPCGIPCGMQHPNVGCCPHPLALHIVCITQRFVLVFQDA